MPTGPVVLKNSLQDLDLNPGHRESSACQPSRHCGLFSGLWWDCIKSGHWPPCSLLLLLFLLLHNWMHT